MVTIGIEMARMSKIVSVEDVDSELRRGRRIRVQASKRCKVRKRRRGRRSGITERETVGESRLRERTVYVSIA